MSKEIIAFSAIAGKTNEYEEITHLWLGTQGYLNNERLILISLVDDCHEIH